MIRALIISSLTIGIVFSQTTLRASTTLGATQQSPTPIPSLAQPSPLPTDYVIVERAKTADHPDAVYLQQPQGRYISTWHDIPMWADQQNKLYDMVIEVPRGEIQGHQTRLDLPMNPIYAIEPTTTEEIDYIHSYGIMPQTFMNSSEVDAVSGMKGNNQPLHVVEISENPHRVGEVVRVKIVGVLGVKDNDMIDYKLVGVDANSPHVSTLNTLEDVEKAFPDVLAATRGFFRYHKYPTISEIAFDGNYQDAATAEKIISSANTAWNTLIQLPDAPSDFNTESHWQGAAHLADDSKWTQLASN